MTGIPKEFYPTPDELIEKMIEKAFGSQSSLKDCYILEPSAGRGNITDSLIRYFDKRKSSYHCKIDCIEIDHNLRNELKGKYENNPKVNVVYDDFLKFNTGKVYTHVFMNPPFSEGAQHLLKAINMMKDGGTIVCLLNAETVKNPYDNKRKELVEILKREAEVEYITGAFVDAERTTDVEVALITIVIPEREKASFFYEEMKKTVVEDIKADAEKYELILGSGELRADVVSYQVELEAGKAFIAEYFRIAKYLPTGFVEDTMQSWERESVLTPLISLKIGDMEVKGDKTSCKAMINEYIRMLRGKYWRRFFRNKELTSRFTAKMIDDFYSQVSMLSEYDYNEHNINEIKCQMMAMLEKGVEDSIIAAFDKMTEQHSWFPECEKNIHYYNGWRTNIEHKINNKVILPTYGNVFRDNWYREAFSTYEVYNLLVDIEKACAYFCIPGKEHLNMNSQLENASSRGQTKNIELRYFDITLYKKGTVHIKFTCEEALNALNIYGSMKKGWLPQSYGKKHYNEMDNEEKAVVDDFQGEKAYEHELVNPIATRIALVGSDVLMLK